MNIIEVEFVGEGTIAYLPESKIKKCGELELINLLEVHKKNRKYFDSISLSL